MNAYWNRRVRALSPYTPGEQPRSRRFIKLNTNENPYPPPGEVIAAIREAADADLRLYPDPECLELRTAIARAWGLAPEQVLAGNGSDELLAFAFAALFNGEGGEPILFPDITYSFYPVYARLWETPFEQVPLRTDFSLDIDGYDRPNAGALIANPNAPTGRVLALEDLRTLIERQLARRRVAVVDEAYAAFAPEPASAAPYINEYPNLLVVHTLSKAASLAGLRVGYALGSAGLIDGLRRVRDSFNSYTLDRLALAGGTAALGCRAYYEERIRRVVATRERVSRELAARGYEVIPSGANFIFMRRPGAPGAALTASLRAVGILTRRWDLPRIADYLRVSIGSDPDMDLFLNALF